MSFQLRHDDALFPNYAAGPALIVFDIIIRKLLNNSRAIQIPCLLQFMTRIVILPDIVLLSEGITVFSL